MNFLLSLICPVWFTWACLSEHVLCHRHCCRQRLNSHQQHSIWKRLQGII